MIALKAGVSLTMTPENVTILDAVNGVLSTFGLVTTVTSGNDGTHRADSKHYSNAALDFRIAWIPSQEPSILQAIRGALPPGYRYVRETDHLHVERASVPDNLPTTRGN